MADGKLASTDVTDWVDELGQEAAIASRNLADLAEATDIMAAQVLRVAHGQTYENSSGDLGLTMRWTARDCRGGQKGTIGVLPDSSAGENSWGCTLQI